MNSTRDNISSVNGLIDLLGAVHLASDQQQTRLIFTRRSDNTTGIYDGPRNQQSPANTPSPFFECFGSSTVSQSSSYSESSTASSRRHFGLTMQQLQWSLQKLQEGGFTEAEMKSLDALITITEREHYSKVESSQILEAMLICKDIKKMCNRRNNTQVKPNSITRQ